MGSRSRSHLTLIFCFLSKKNAVLKTMESVNTKTSVNTCMKETIPYESRKKATDIQELYFEKGGLGQNKCDLFSNIWKSLFIMLRLPKKNIGQN